MRHDLQGNISKFLVYKQFLGQQKFLVELKNFD